MCSYLSKQRGRSYHVWTDYLECSDYCSMKSLLRTGDLFNKDFCYDLIPEYLNPMDYETFRKYPGKAYAVAANIATGKAEYLRLAGTQKDCEAVRASSSLPLISRNVRLGDQLYLDGGLADSIPIRKSILDGNRKNVVVLTKEVGYRKEPSSHLGLVKIRYLRYPKVYEMMKVRHIVYNRTLDYLEKQVQNGQAFVIRPSYAMGINRIEKDKEKLKALYQQGYDEAAAQYDRLMEYLEK